MQNTPEQWYKGLPILTRIGISTFFVVSLLAQLQILDPRLLFLNWPLVVNKLQVWRLLTSVCYVGPFGFPFLIQMYFFQSFSSKLELNEIHSQPGDYLFFLFAQILLLDIVSLVLYWPTGSPLLGPSLVFAILYYWSRREPYAALSFYGFSVQGYQLPFWMLMLQMLMGGSIWSELLGIATGHLWYFFKEVVPAEYGYSFIKTPQFVRTFMARQVGGGAAAPAGARVAGFGGGAGAGQRLGGEGAAAPQPQQRFFGQGQRLGGT